MSLKRRIGCVLRRFGSAVSDALWRARADAWAVRTISAGAIDQRAIIQRTYEKFSMKTKYGFGGITASGFGLAIFSIIAYDESFSLTLGLFGISIAIAGFIGLAMGRRTTMISKELMTTISKEGKETREDNEKTREEIAKVHDAILDEGKKTREETISILKEIRDDIRKNAQKT